MESTEQLKIRQLKIVEREQVLQQWLQDDCSLPSYELQAMPGDASLRRYFRVVTPAATFVAMDAPPPQENCHPYVAIAKALREMNLDAPQVIHANLEMGFLLLSDFGDATYLNTLNAGNADKLYHHALDALAVLQGCRQVPNHSIPPFTRDFMWKEWAWHKEWFLTKLLGLNVDANEAQLDACYQLIVESAATQPQVFMHRDYHSANLMVLSDNVGILDFQDAFIGPVTYDPVSLLRDCYIDWPEERVQQWLVRYWQTLMDVGALCEVSLEEFSRWFDLMGMQRHLKALLTYARKHVRDQQSRYLQFVPRALTYLLNVSERYTEFSALNEYLRGTVSPTYERLFLCAQ